MRCWSRLTGNWPPRHVSTAAPIVAASCIALSIPVSREVGGEMRLSYCCESCRRRTTPASVRFLGRRVYSAAVMVLGSALPGRLSVAAARTLCGALKEPKRTLERWRRWWRQSFVTTPQWILGGASFTTADAAHLNRPITRRVGSRAGNARRSEPLTRQKLNKLLYG